MSTQHRLLTSAAALVGLAPAAAVTPPAAATPAGDAPTNTVDVVTVDTARAEIASARTEGAAAERDRTNKVLSSDAAKSNFSTAAFLLNTSPSASADEIVAHLGLLSAGAAAAAPAPTPAPAPAPAAPAATLTHDLKDTPKIDVGAAANGGNADEGVDAEKFWSGHLNTANAEASKPFGADIAPGVRRTGN